MSDRPGGYETELWRKWGRLLGEARVDAGLSKRAAADKIGVSEGTWRKYEDGGRASYGGVWALANPSAQNLRTIERVFGVFIDTESGTAWREDRPDTGNTAEGPGAYSGDPSQLAGILAELNQTVGELRDEVRRLNRQRGEDEDEAQPVDDAGGPS